MTQNSLYRFQIQKSKQPLDLCPADRIRFNILVSLVGKRKRVLELGCGHGVLAKSLIDQGNQVTGLDISPEAIKKAKKRGIKAFTCNLETDKWPVKNNFFDVVVASEIIEHLLDTDKFLENIHQSLKPKGHLILTTPNTASLGRRLFLLTGRNPYFEPSFHPLRAGHVRYFVKDSLFILLGKHKFQVELFTSDVIMFNQSQTVYSTKLARLFPTLGKSLIIKAKKNPL